MKLNKKGFTLIELLAVIVILAIILVIVVPKVFDVIDSSKTKSLESSAKSLVKAWSTYETSRIINGKEALTSLVGVSDGYGYYACINEHDAGILGISKSDYVVGNHLTVNPKFIAPCSVVAKIDGEIDIVLVAKPTGTVYSDAKVQTFPHTYGGIKFMYASSDGHNSWNNQYIDVNGDAYNWGENFKNNHSDVLGAFNSIVDGNGCITDGGRLEEYNIIGTTGIEYGDGITKNSCSTADYDGINIGVILVRKDNGPLWYANEIGQSDWVS